MKVKEPKSADELHQIVLGLLNRYSITRAQRQVKIVAHPRDEFDRNWNAIPGEVREGPDAVAFTLIFGQAVTNVIDYARDCYELASS
ncbi:MULTISPECIES: hypothetical protein [unclassified Burkholderia]|uniref:hypothetical protein n=1 Tax=unclassified Burkholderia TaxID=2613784 RepID=UPI0012E39F87|nr:MULTISPECIES: hypothetical protein [unclassified Burkholderia]